MWVMTSMMEDQLLLSHTAVMFYHAERGGDQIIGTTIHPLCIRMYKLNQSGNVIQIFNRGLLLVASTHPASDINSKDMKDFLNVVYQYTINGRDSLLNP